VADLIVVGGGIAGLAAAWDARRRGAEVVLFEASAQVGGKIRTSPVAGVPLDESADAFLGRVPEAVELCRELGLGDELVSPATGSAYIWSGGALRRLPADQLLGVPTDLDAVAESEILTPDGLARAREDLERPDDRPDGDEAVGALIRRRLGDEVLDKLVAPLVGGIWAADCDALSLQVATPALADARRRDPSLVRGAVAVRSAATATEQPVFLAPRGGMGRLVEALATALGDAVRVGQAVTAIEPVDGGWRVGDVTAPGVVVATPAFAAAPLLAPHAPAAAELLGGVGYASVALVTLVVPRDGIDRELDGSGFLVPPSEGRLLTACSWTSSKWGHLDLDPSLAVLRASAGRAGDERALGFSDDALVATLRADLHETMGLQAAPVEVRVSRWSRSFPQPRPGHLDRVATIDADLPAGIALAGAWRNGVGIPACIRSGRAGATAVAR
jgi:oxygen-dependent protoporphyrinogen oxidase